IEFASIVLEALGAATKNIVNDAYYEVTLNGQKTRDEESIEMLDIIFDNVGADIAHIYNWDMMGWMLNGLISNETLEFTSFYQSYQSKLEAAIAKTMESYE
ncbi:MAG TPA: hypothetical protein PLT66_08460, partial [Bacillota bacterium]|nr:hypothetical protein [Bacillota bacterium]